MKIIENHLSWVPDGHKEQYKNWIKKLNKSKRFKHAREKNIENGNPPFEEMWEVYCPSAYRLKAYMDFRAFHEKLEHRFTERFYIKSFFDGIFNLFGITCCDCCGRILKDEQNPTAYKWFCEFEEEEIENIKKELNKGSNQLFFERTLH